jgi:hypothetical protein
MHRRDWQFTPHLQIEAKASRGLVHEEDGEPDEFTLWLGDQLEQLEARHGARTIRVLVVLVLAPQN